VSIKLAQNSDLSQQKVGEVVWDASHLLAKYIEEHVPVTGRRVVELGAGCALVGITTALLGGDVVVTDRERELQAAIKNIALNRHTFEVKHVVAGKLTAQVLAWGDLPSLQPLRPPVDLIVGADLLYYSKAFPLLITTLRGLASPQTTIVLCNQWRGLAEQSFVTLAKEHFHVHRVPRGHLDQDLIQYQDLRIYRLRLKT